MKAHKIGNIQERKKIYGFAAGCFSQKAPGLGNAAEVAFYEHVAEGALIWRDMLKWVKPHIFAAIEKLLQI